MLNLNSLHFYHKVDVLATQNKEMQKKIENIEASRFPYGWKYLGRGTYGTRDTYVHKQPATFTECVNLCEEKRSSDVSWNGFTYLAFSQSCYCNKNDRGHDTGYPLVVHFKFE